MYPFIIILAFCSIVLANTSIYSGIECQTCLADSANSICRHKSGTISSAFCCTDSDISKTRTSCGDSPMCSNVINSTLSNSTEMRALFCPHEPYPCGAKSPEIGLNLVESKTLKINQYFDFGDSCYYHIYANDRVNASFDPYNLKYL